MAESLPNLSATGPDYPVAGGLLTVDLDALAANYRALAIRSAPAVTAAAVKADAYGLGVAEIVPALARAGCRHFFVALPAEGAEVRRADPQAEIYVLSGLFASEAAAIFRENRLVPVLNSPLDIAVWAAEGWHGETALPCVLHIDTGMNRLGLTLEEAAAFAAENALTGAVNVALVMSHLACADEPAHPLNARQIEAFAQARTLFPGVPASLANSAGTLIGGDYLCDLTRPGIALYGGAAVRGIDNPMLPVARAEARIAQLRHARAGEVVGYGAAHVLTRDTLVAIVTVGYADGFLRAGSGSGVEMRKARAAGGFGAVAGRRVPVLGRISMDLTAFDVTDIPEGEIQRGGFIELFGPALPLDEAAAAAGTIGYELLTSLGRRYHRIYSRSIEPDG